MQLSYAYLMKLRQWVCITKSSKLNIYGSMKKL